MHYAAVLLSFYFFPSDLQSFRDELNRSSKTAFADIWADEDLQQIFVFLQFSLSNWRYSCIVHCNSTKSVNLFSQGLEVKAEESHLRSRLQLKSIKRILWALLGLSVSGDTFRLLCLKKKKTLIISISFLYFQNGLCCLPIFCAPILLKTFPMRSSNSSTLRMGSYNNVPK